jgi:hypothetical protein
MLKVEAVGSPQTLPDASNITMRIIPEDQHIILILLLFSVNDHNRIIPNMLRNIFNALRYIFIS